MFKPKYLIAAIDVERKIPIYSCCSTTCEIVGYDTKRNTDIVAVKSSYGGVIDDKYVASKLMDAIVYKNHVAGVKVLDGKSFRTKFFARNFFRKMRNKYQTTVFGVWYPRFLTYPLTRKTDTFHKDE